MELKPNSIQVYSDVLGTKRHKKDIMISAQENKGDEIHDIFLTNKQAIELCFKLAKKIKL